jgi:hypothetical protein
MSGQVDMGAVAALRRELAGAEQLWAHVVTAHSGCFAVEEVSRAQGVLAR